MNLEGWQAGLVLGAGFTVVLEAAIRAVLFKVRHRGHDHCRICRGCLGSTGRSLYAVETLTVCSACGDTYPAEARSQVEPIGLCNCGKPGCAFVLADVCDEHAKWLESVIATIPSAVPQGPAVRLISEGDPAPVATRRGPL